MSFSKKKKKKSRYYVNINFSYCFLLCPISYDLLYIFLLFKEILKFKKKKKIKHIKNYDQKNILYKKQHRGVVFYKIVFNVIESSLSTRIRLKMREIQIRISNQSFNFAPCNQNYLFLKSFISSFQNQIWDNIINIHQNELLSIKTKECKINES